MIKVVVFDLDDTLYLERDYVRSGFKAVDFFLQEKGIEGFFKAAWSYFEKGGRGNTFNVVLDELGVSYDKPFVMGLITVYREHSPNISLLPDSLEIIKSLQGKYHLGLITDGYSQAQNNKVDALGLRDLLDCIVVTDDLGEPGEFWKPHAKPYETSSTHFSVANQACVYIGDNLKKDFVTANKLGWTTVQICRDGGEYDSGDVPAEYQADYKISSLKEFPELMFRF